MSLKNFLPDLFMRSRYFLLWLLGISGGVYTLGVYTQGTRNPLAADNIPVAAIGGKLVWQKYNCVSCHQVYGLGGFMGPDLTNVITEKGMGYVYAKIKWGDRRMPDLKLKEEEINAVVAYLGYLSGTGKSPARGYPLPWYNYEKGTDRNRW